MKSAPRRSSSITINKKHPMHFICLPIFNGILRGTFWFPSSGGKILRIFLGSYEREQTEAFTKQLQACDVLFDVGAHVGYYTLLGSRLVGEEGKVLAFEPNPRNVFFLRKHISQNRIANVTVQESAVGEAAGIARFTAGTGTGTGHVAKDGEVEVTMHCIDEIVAGLGILPTHMKIDVEGLELQVLKGSRKTLARARPTIFLSTHGTEVHKQCCRLLADADFLLQPILGESVEDSSELLCSPQ